MIDNSTFISDNKLLFQVFLKFFLDDHCLKIWHSGEKRSVPWSVGTKQSLQKHEPHLWHNIISRTPSLFSFMIGTCTALVWDIPHAKEDLTHVEQINLLPLDGHHIHCRIVWCFWEDVSHRLLNSARPLANAKVSEAPKGQILIAHLEIVKFWL